MHSPFDSLTSSYAAAEQYALVGKHHATPQTPGYVYQITVPDIIPQGVEMHDAALYIASELQSLSNTLTHSSYRHNGNREFLLSVVDPHGFGHLKTIPPSLPRGLASAHGPNLTADLEAMVNALRDAEILIFRIVPQAWVSDRFDVH